MVRSYKSLPNYPGKSDVPGNIFREQLPVSYGRLLTIHDEITEILDDIKEDSTSWVFLPEINKDKLRTLQDEMKSKLKAQRELACRCAYVEDDEASEEELCQLPVELNTMNDYSYRILLPIHKSMTNPSGDDTLKIKDIIYYRVRRLSEFRCENDLDNPGCLNNKEIDEFK